MSNLRLCPCCERRVTFFAMTKFGACEDCVRTHGRDWRESFDAKRLSAEAEIARRLEQKEIIDWSAAPLDVVQTYASHITVTTGLNIPRRDIESVIDVISAETALGMNVFRDLANVVRDTFGGRSKTLQDTLRLNRQTCIAELRREALLVGADAVIGVDLDYSEFSSTGGIGGMLFTVATGTAVKLQPVTP